MDKILIVDNNDSFVFNLAHLLREVNRYPFELIKSAKINIDGLESYSHILLSPGPGIPEEFPNSLKILERCSMTHSILGVCLGFQMIVKLFGGGLKQLDYPKHGYQDRVKIISPDSQLLKGVSNGCLIGRYHSWVADPLSFPDSLTLLATDGDGNIAAVSHKSLPIYGVQFHPESYMTECGEDIIRNWLSL